MTDYEVLIMLDPELAEDRQQEVVDRIRKQVVEGGGVSAHLDPLSRTLHRRWKKPYCVAAC